MVPVYIAATTLEADEVEAVLVSLGVAFNQRLEVVMHETSNACYQGTLFEVDAAQIADVRRALAARGFARGMQESAAR